MQSGQMCTCWKRKQHGLSNHGELLIPFFLAWPAGPSHPFALSLTFFNQSSIRISLLSLSTKQWAHRAEVVGGTIGKSGIAEVFWTPTFFCPSLKYCHMVLWIIVLFYYFIACTSIWIISILCLLTALWSVSPTRRCVNPYFSTVVFIRVFPTLRTSLGIW